MLDDMSEWSAEAAALRLDQRFSVRRAWHAHCPAGRTGTVSVTIFASTRSTSCGICDEYAPGMPREGGVLHQVQGKAGGTSSRSAQVQGIMTGKLSMKSASETDVQSAADRDADELQEPAA